MPIDQSNPKHMRQIQILSRSARFTLIVIVFTPIAAVSQMQIVGTGQVCPNQQYSYQLTGINEGCTQFEWFATHGHVDGLNGAIAYVTWSPGYTSGSISCIPNCDSTQYDKLVLIGQLPTPPTISKNSSNFEICSTESWTLTCNSNYGTSYGYDWYISYASPPGGSGVLLDGSSFGSGSPLHTQNNTVTLTAPSGYGDFFASVRLSPTYPACPSSYVNFEGQAGVLNSSQFGISGPSALCPNSTGSFNALTPYAQGITDFTWGTPSEITIQSGQGTSTLGVGTTSSFTGGVVVLRLSNRCGMTGSPATKFVAQGSCFMMTISPNPSTRSVQLKISDLNQSGETGGMANTRLSKPARVSLLNQAGREVWSSTEYESSFNIDVTNIPNGEYYLKVTNGAEKLVERILIAH